MHTSRDQIQALRFMSRRLDTATLGADPDERGQPLARQGRSALAGIFLAALALAAAGIYGVVSPGGAQAWRDTGGLVLEKETGTRYLYRGGVLYPVLNYTSARLILRQPDPPLISVSAASLDGVPHGQPVGIPGAPDTLPGADALLRDAWRVCAHAGRDERAQPRPVLTIDLASTPAAGARRIAHGEALLVRGPDGHDHLIWEGRRYRATSAAFLGALGFAAVTPLAVPAGWLGVVPVGPDLNAIAVSQLGAVTTVDGRPARVGQVLVVHQLGGGSAYYLLLRQGVIPITPVQAALQLADPTTRGVYPHATAEPVEVSASAVVTAGPAMATALPATPPQPVLAGAPMTACLAIPASGDGDSVTVTLEPATVTGPPVDSPPGPDGPVADRVNLPAGGAALVAAVPHGQADPGAVYLITDLGLRYPISGSDALDALGYGSVSAVRMPAALVALVPVGPRLDPAVADQLLAPGAPSQPPGES